MGNINESVLIRLWNYKTPYFENLAIFYFILFCKVEVYTYVLVYSVLLLYCEMIAISKENGTVQKKNY